MKKEKLIDNRNKNLYDRVREHYKVNLKKSDDHSWGSHIEKDTVIISHSQTKYPISAFTHELLHPDTQLNGYKRIRAGLSLNKDTHQHMGRLISCIDNEFQHHKMFDKFIELGFPANEFYNDLDTETIPHLERILKTTGKTFISLSVEYLTLIAPGGVIPTDQLEELKQSFYNYDGGKYGVQFKTIDKIIADWKADTSYNAEKYVIQFFQNLNAGQTWISYSDNLAKGLSADNFPSTGFYTNSSFTLEEIAKAFGQ
jgi:hypothetical protein